MRKSWMLGVVVVLGLAGCQVAPGAIEGPVSTAGGVVLPPVSGVFDYQLGGAYDLSPGVDVVVRDASDAPARGAYNICYVNGFQTQPGEKDAWAGDREDLLLHDADGELVLDPDWPDEYILDPSSASQRDGILKVIGPVITGCADDGYDAVEIDNLDTWIRFTDPADGVISESGAMALARAYVALAHQHGLAIGQKNAAEIAETGHADIGFDFAVTEECAAYDECSAYTSVYGKQVLQIEYTDNLPAPFTAVCERGDRAPLTILRDRDLATADNSDYAYEQCPADG
ncbi:endo alpha-1,4 polygalactosaminidase [Saxibacter everestensis]|uniref:Endo alpha-1,4 polygalactosaminidase n=1 Tax=Saxibacter everestensis TaxID=2909229 RepID=A0ABY8QUV7_9MICO|nr:endo alpha-1,4 polygalactosaminidase [Brevibacteriaceae bacterium ZFBP1038]